MALKHGYDLTVAGDFERFKGDLINRNKEKAADAFRNINMPHAKEIYNKNFRNSRKCFFNAEEILDKYHEYFFDEEHY